MRGCKLWYALGGIPAREENWKFLVDDTRPAASSIRLSSPKCDPAIATVTVREMMVGCFELTEIPWVQWLN